MTIGVGYTVTDVLPPENQVASSDSHTRRVAACMKNQAPA